MTHNISRRRFLRASLGLIAGMAALPAFNGPAALAQRGRRPSGDTASGSYGPLVPTPDQRDGVKRLALPEGFQYRSFHLAGQRMSDGNRVPLAHDGMAGFVMPDGRVRLVCNHEDRNGPGKGSTAFDEATGYDPLGGSGTTTLVVDPVTRELQRHFISLNGTIVNCAGGPTPWRTWISCEETNAGTPQGWARQHGYCFDVPANGDSPVRALPIKDMGRFSHEAVAVDPNTGVVYETEDNALASGFYRFLPATPGVLADGGRLQMLGIDGKRDFDAYRSLPVGTHLPVVWYDIPDPDPPGTSATAVSSQGRAQGAAHFARLEGCWYGNGAVYFASTDGGSAGCGQIWEYRPEANGGMLRLLFDSPGTGVLNCPDQLTVSPQGSLLICDDPPPDAAKSIYLRGLTQDGEIFAFASQLTTHSDWAGATFVEFDPNRLLTPNKPRPTERRWDGITLFVNIQGVQSGDYPPDRDRGGMTFAIWGPWQNGAL